MVSIINNWSPRSYENMDEDLSDALPVLEESGRGCRSKRKQVDPTCCPVCSVTLRDNELESHLDTELDKLSKLTGKHKKCHKILPSNSVCTSTPSTTLGKGWETYQKVRANRHVRQKSKSKKRKTDEVTCPVCNKTTSEDITLHVEMCLQQAEKGHCNNGSSDDENIDVEGFEEYEWAGQTRIRASSLLEGGFANTGIATSVTRANSDEEDIDVIVDGDDTQVYGSVQYSNEDLKHVNEQPDIKPLDELSDSPKKDCPINSENGWPNELSPYPVLDALKSRIRELESRDQNKELYKCLICMGVYKTPVVSVCCWHVHCEQCWLQTLATKKLCPQCNMITNTSDLRRIYI